MQESSSKPTTYAIPLHRPQFSSAEANALVDVLETGLLTGDGAASAALMRAACDLLGCASAYPTPSGTHALELMCRSLELEPGDEIICPSFTFVSVANAILLAGGTPVFADIDPDTLNLDSGDAAAHVTGRTRAVLTAHYGGIASHLTELDALAHARGFDLLEDAAHALGGRFDGRPLGTWGRAAAFSFHGTKNIVAGEGGMFVTHDRELAARAEIIREKGTDRSRFLRGDVDRYTWQAIGSSYLMSDLLAALVLSQWRRLDAVTVTRGERFAIYHRAFEPLAQLGALTRPVVPEGCNPAYHIYYVLAESAGVRDRLIVRLRRLGIEASSHFEPLHLSPYAQRTLRTRPGMLPVTEQIAARLLRLPLYPSLSEVEQRTVIDAVFAFFGQRPS